MSALLIDSHCHLDFPDFADDLPGVLTRASAAGIGEMITISTRVAKADVYRQLAEESDRVFFSIGTHPHNADDELDVTVGDLVRHSAHPRCVAIGETGLDFHYNKSSPAGQEQSFRVHIAAARETGLPLVIHARNADEAMARILTEEMARGRFSAVLHCFSSGAALAKTGLELGLYLSFSGILSFKSSHEIKTIAAAAPIDRVLVETDAPYLAPVPHRGKRNEPAFTRHTAGVLAEVKGVSFEEIAARTRSNTLELFSKMTAAAKAGLAA